MKILDGIEAIFFLGPTGCGKDTQISLLLGSKLGTKFLRWPSITTRLPRDDDVPGKYEYVSDEEMDTLETSGALVECKLSQNGQRYATPWSTYHQAKASGKVLVKDINFEGAEEMYKLFGAKGRYIYFFLPLSKSIERIVARHGDAQPPLTREFLDSRKAKTREENHWALDDFRPRLESDHPNARLFRIITASHSREQIHKEVLSFLTFNGRVLCP